MSSEQYKIIHLPVEQWKLAKYPFRYTSYEYYDVEMTNDETGFHIELEKKSFDKPVYHYPEQHDFPDKLYQDYRDKPYAWGIVGEDGQLLACIETSAEDWSNRLIVDELWVHEDLRGKGWGKKLMDIAKRQAQIEHRRAIILETQSCNVHAIEFYMSQGFRLIGFDTCCYSNKDIERKEVRFNMGYFLRAKHVKKDDVIIRAERESDFKKVEEIALNAFWNKHTLGANEHLLVHKIRSCPDYLPELSRVAEINGEVAGAIFYTRAHLETDKGRCEIANFGPLVVANEWQGCGIGGMLLDETLRLAREAGVPGIVIFGEPTYYPMHGFKTCDNFGITTADGKNFDAFMGIELAEGGLSCGGRFIESPVFEQLTDEENEEYTKLFDAPEKQKFPSQWA